MQDLLLLILVVVLIVGFAIYLFRTLAKLFVFLGIAYFLFHVAFLWDSEKLIKVLPEEYFKPEYRTAIEQFIRELPGKREEYAMLDTEKMEQDIDSLIKTAIQKAKDTYNDVDKEALVESVYTIFKGTNFEEAEAELLSMKDSFTSSGVSDEEFNLMMTRLEEMMTTLNSIENRLDAIENGTGE